MIRRDQLVLTLSAALGACRDPIVGDWELTALGSGPLTYTDNQSGVYGYGCGEYTRDLYTSLSGLLSLDAELEASLTLEYSLVYYLYIEGCEEVDIDETYSYTYAGPAALRASGDYQIQLRSGSDDRMPLTCALSDDTLDCEGDLESFEFTRL